MVDAASGKTGGLYMPPYKLAQMMKEVRRDSSAKLQHNNYRKHLLFFSTSSLRGSRR